VIRDHRARQLGDTIGISIVAHASHDRNSTPVEISGPQVAVLS
jgi:hypothetical protein